MDEKIIARFRSRVQHGAPNACWPWIGWRNRKGYGSFWDGKRTRPAAQVALELAGKPRPGKLQACHSCDNPPCSNPAHLGWGTGKRNISEGVARGRRKHLVGEAHNRAELTHLQAMQMRQRFINGERIGALAAEFGVSRATVSHTARGRNWSHVPLTANQQQALASRAVVYPDRRGERASHSKLNEALVRKLRRERSGGAKLAELARRYGVSQGLVSSICLGRSWSHVV